MGKRVKLSEAALKKMIMESIMGEVNKSKLMPPKYKEIFIRRVKNAAHGGIGDVEKAVQEFYVQFRDKIPGENFTLDNLMDFADDIERDERGGGHGNPGARRQGASDGWWATNQGKFLEENKIRLSESQLRNLIKKSVRKVMKESLGEISYDMLTRARDKFKEKYYTPIVDKDGKKTGYFQPYGLTHPKDKRPLAQHEHNFDSAIEKAVRDEHPEIIEKAKELVKKVDNWEVDEITDRIDYHCAEAGIYGEAQDENGEWWGFWAGGMVDDGEIVEVYDDYDVKFEAPNGMTGWC